MLFELLLVYSDAIKGPCNLHVRLWSLWFSFGQEQLVHSLMEQARYVSYGVGPLVLFHACISLMESCIIFVPH